MTDAAAEALCAGVADWTPYTNFTEAPYLGRLMAHEYWKEAKHLFGLDAETDIMKLVERRAVKEIQDAEDRVFFEHLGRIIMDELKKGWRRMTKTQLIGALTKMKIELDARPTVEQVNELSSQGHRLVERNAQLDKAIRDLVERNKELEEKYQKLADSHNLERDSHRALVKVVNRLY